MRIKRVLSTFFACCCTLLLLQGLFFGIILSQPPAPRPAELIAVFMGNAGRVEAGKALYQQGYAPRLLFSPSTEKQLRRLPASFGPGLIIEEQARTTFENALYTRRLILQHNIRSVMLVTSQYHMPRSYFLMQAALLGSGVQVYRYPVVNERQAFNFPPQTARDMKVLHNEMIEFWGSLGEWAGYALRGRVPEQGTQESRILRTLRQALLFDV